MTDLTATPTPEPDSPPSFETALPEPFEVSFDYNDEAHCSWGVDGALEELDDALVARLGDDIRTLDDDPASDRILSLVKQLETERDDLEDQRDDLEDPELLDADSDEGAAEAVLEAAAAAADRIRTDIETLEGHIDALKEAAARLTYCEHGCCCGNDAWEGAEQDWVNEQLDALGNRVWSVREERWRGPDYTEEDVEDILDMDRITPDSASQRGWSEFHAKWDGTALTVTFAYDRGHSERIFTPLTDAQVDVRADWLERCWCDEDVASRLLTLEPAVVETAFELWDAIPGAGDRYTLAELVKTVTAMTEPTEPTDPATTAGTGTSRADRLRTFDAATLHVLSALAADWKGSLTELLDVARSVTGTAIAAGTANGNGNSAPTGAAADVRATAFALSYAA